MYLYFVTQGPAGIPGLEGPKVRYLCVCDNYSVSVNSVPFCGLKAGYAVIFGLRLGFRVGFMHVVAEI